METSKPFWASLTLWGALVTAYGMAATPLHLPMPAGGVEGLADQVVEAIGIVMTIIGRFRAKKALAVT